MAAFASPFPYDEPTTCPTRHGRGYVVVHLGSTDVTGGDLLWRSTKVATTEFLRVLKSPPPKYRAPVVLAPRVWVPAQRVIAHRPERRLLSGERRQARPTSWLRARRRERAGS